MPLHRQDKERGIEADCKAKEKVAKRREASTAAHREPSKEVSGSRLVSLPARMLMPAAYGACCNSHMDGRSV